MERSKDDEMADKIEIENCHPLMSQPEGVQQHKTAGPYSPVLEVDGRRLVVISGQVSIDLEGNVIGSSIEEQTIATLNNCAQKLAAAGCTLADVFKVNIYLADLGQWGLFNSTYEQIMPRPLPTRTAVQCVLLPGFIVEIEMWAVKAAED